MNTKRLAAVLAALLALAAAIPAVADWSGAQDNLSKYEALYGGDAEGYKAIRYNAQSSQVSKVKEALAQLGFFPYKISDNYYRSLEASIRVFAGQMRIGGDGSEITPLMQAMLADSANLPKAISPVIDVSEYSWEPDSSSTSFTPYSYQRLNRTSVQNGTKVGFQGRIVASVYSGAVCYYAVQLDSSDADSRVYVTYEPLPQTTVFQTGDQVAVFGTTAGSQGLGYEGMQEAALNVRADRVGYGKVD